MYTETMNYYRRLSSKFDKGFNHGESGKRPQPGLTFGKLRSAYFTGYSEGKKVRRMKVKTK